MVSVRVVMVISRVSGWCCRIICRVLVYCVIRLSMICFVVCVKWFCWFLLMWCSSLVLSIGVRVREMKLEIRIVIVRVMVNLWNSCLVMLFMNSSGISMVISEKVSEMMVKLICFEFLSVVFSGELFCFR